MRRLLLEHFSHWDILCTFFLHSNCVSGKFQIGAKWLFWLWPVTELRVYILLSRTIMTERHYISWPWLTRCRAAPAASRVTSHFKEVNEAITVFTNSLIKCATGQMCSTTERAFNNFPLTSNPGCTKEITVPCVFFPKPKICVNMSYNI